MSEKVLIRRLKEVSVNEQSLKVVKEMMQREDSLDIDVIELKNHITIIDTGVNVKGGFKAAEYVTKAALCGFGEAKTIMAKYGSMHLPAVVAYTDLPAIIAISYYVWPEVMHPPHVKTDEYSAWVSGPGKALKQKPEKVYAKLDYKDEGSVAVLLVQPRGKQLPDESVAEKLANACGINPENLYLLVTPTNSIVGSVQVSARTMEDGFWRLTEYYGISYDRVEEIMTLTPIAPVSPKVFREPCPWADDMIRHGGVLHAWIYSKEGEDLQKMAEEMVIENNPKSFGKSFYQLAVIEKKYIGPEYDLVRLAEEGCGFVIAEACLYDTRVGRMYRAGRVHDNILEKLLSNPW